MSEAVLPIQILIEIVDEYRDTFGVEPICNPADLPSECRRRAALQREQQQRCARARHYYNPKL